MKSNITSTVKAIAKGLIILICGVVAGTILLTAGGAAAPTHSRITPAAMAYSSSATEKSAR